MRCEAEKMQGIGALEDGTEGNSKRSGEAAGQPKGVSALPQRSFPPKYDQSGRVQMWILHVRPAIGPIPQKSLRSCSRWSLPTTRARCVLCGRGLELVQLVLVRAAKCPSDGRRTDDESGI